MSPLEKWKHEYFAVMAEWMEEHKGKPNWREVKERFRKFYLKNHPAPKPNKEERAQMQKLQQLNKVLTDQLLGG
jgi:hypothetical protein